MELGEVKTWFKKKPGLKALEERERENENNVNIWVWESCQQNRSVTNREGRLCLQFIVFSLLRNNEVSSFNKFWMK